MAEILERAMTLLAEGHVDKSSWPYPSIGKPSARYTYPIFLFLRTLILGLVTLPNLASSLAAESDASSRRLARYSGLRFPRTACACSPINIVFVIPWLCPVTCISFIFVSCFWFLARKYVGCGSSCETRRGPSQECSMD